MVTNKYKVPKRQWNKWTPEGQGAFNVVHSAMNTQELIKHPKAAKQSREHWKTIAWNAAWMAADAVTDVHLYGKSHKRKIVIVKGR